MDLYLVYDTTDANPDFLSRAWDGAQTYRNASVSALASEAEAVGAWVLGEGDLWSDCICIWSIVNGLGIARERI